MASKLEQLRAMTVVVADAGDIDAVRRLKPQDCTTNPTLLLKAVENPAYAHLVEEAVGWGRRHGATAAPAAAAAMCDRLFAIDCRAYPCSLTRHLPADHCGLRTHTHLAASQPGHR